MSRIVFVCVEKSSRSQMAEGFARYYGTGNLEAFSAGSRPSGKVNETAVQVMKEVGIDISSQASKGFACRIRSLMYWLQWDAAMSVPTFLL